MTATEFETAPTSASDDADAGESSRARRRRRSPWGLRRRILFSFTFGSTFLALLLALTTYGLARSNVVQQREGTSIDTSRRNAQTVQASLRGPATDVQPAVDALEAFGVERAVVWYGGQWSPGSGRYRETALPQSLVDRVIEDAVPARMIVEVDGEPTIVVGWPLANDAAYFEFFSLDEVAATLGSVRLSLYLAGLITIVLGIIVGMSVGVGVAVITWASPLIAGLASPLVLMMRSIPIVAIIPVVARLVGYGNQIVPIVTVLLAFFPAYVLTTSGLRSAPATSVDMFTALGASRTCILRRLLIGSALPNITFALRLSASSAVLAAMVAEFLAGTTGLGRLFATARTRFDNERPWGAAVIGTIASVVLFQIALRIERSVRARYR